MQDDQDNGAETITARDPLEDAFLRLEQFVRTPTAELHLQALDYAYHHFDIVMLACRSGTGKSTACKHFADSYPRTWIVEGSRVQDTEFAALAEVARAMDMRGFPTVRTGCAKISIMSSAGAAE